MAKWFIHQDRTEDDPELNSYSITQDENIGGWRTDGGYDGYGLPKQLAQWICDILNKTSFGSPFEMNSWGGWEKTKKKKVKKNV